MKREHGSSQQPSHKHEKKQLPAIGEDLRLLQLAIIWANQGDNY